MILFPFFLPEFWELLCIETNRFVQQYLDAHRDTLPPRSRFRRWVGLNVPDMKVFMALYLNMGLNWTPEFDLF